MRKQEIVPIAGPSSDHYFFTMAYLLDPDIGGSGKVTYYGRLSERQKARLQDEARRALEGRREE